MSYVFRRVSSLQPEKKVVVVCLAGARSLLRPGKKSSSRLSGGCAEKKKNLGSHLSGGCAIVITTGKKSSSRLSVGCAIIITTGKKSSSRLSGGCTIVITTGKKKVLVVCLAGAQSLLRPEKKSSSRLSGGLCCCVSFWFWQEIGFGNSFWCYVGT